MLGEIKYTHFDIGSGWEKKGVWYVYMFLFISPKETCTIVKKTASTTTQVVWRSFPDFSKVHCEGYQFEAQTKTQSKSWLVNAGRTPLHGRCHNLWQRVVVRNSPYKSHKIRYFYFIGSHFMGHCTTASPLRVLLCCFAFVAWGEMHLGKHTLYIIWYLKFINMYVHKNNK